MTHPLRLAAGLTLLFLISIPMVARADDTPAVAGTWTWKWKDAAGETHRHMLEVEGKNDKLAARERFDDEPAVKVDDIKITGKKIRFSVTRKNRRAEYVGTIETSETINGDVTVTTDGQAAEFGWTAKREAGGK